MKYILFIESILELINHPHLFTASYDILQNNIAEIKTHIMSKITQLYNTFSFDNISATSGKLRTYKKFRKHFNVEQYLKINDAPLAWRKLYCAFRISCHDLEIERGRYVHPKIPPEDRICLLCKNQPETEEHFLIYCSKFANYRKDLYSKLSSIDPQFSQIPTDSRFEYMMTSENFEIIKTVMKYIYENYNRRKTFLKNL